MAEMTLENAPPNVRPFYDKGVAALERDNLDYAMDMFTAALVIEPRLLQIRKLLRTAALKKSRRSPAGKMERLKASGRLLHLAALRKKDPLQALAEAEAILNLDPLNPKFARAHCSAARAAGLPEVAIQTLEFLKQNNAADLATLHELAALYRQAGQIAQEYQCHEKIVEQTPNDARALKQLKDAAARLTMDKSDWKR